VESWKALFYSSIDYVVMLCFSSNPAGNRFLQVVGKFLLKMAMHPFIAMHLHILSQLSLGQN